MPTIIMIIIIIIIIIIILIKTKRERESKYSHIQNELNFLSENIIDSKTDVKITHGQSHLLASLLGQLSAVIL